VNGVVVVVVVVVMMMMIPWPMTIRWRGAAKPAHFRKEGVNHGHLFSHPSRQYHHPFTLTLTAIATAAVAAMDDKDNANPTILNPSDLPSRRSEATVKRHDDGGTGLFDHLIPRYNYLSDPFDEAVSASDSDDDGTVEGIDEQEIYGVSSPPRTCPFRHHPSLTSRMTDLISTISDPEHPLSLGSLAVVNLPDIRILPPTSPLSSISTVVVEITPTITHCSLATVIGLGVRVRLEQALPPRFRVDVRIKKGTHSTDEQVNKQLGDKERVAAALENGTLMGVLKKMLETCT
jgi:metal-sulfur cluster biosynthetic enzyme